jgi:hypothetical protein
MTPIVPQLKMQMSLRRPYPGAADLPDDLSLVDLLPPYDVQVIEMHVQRAQPIAVTDSDVKPSTSQAAFSPLVRLAFGQVLHSSTREVGAGENDDAWCNGPNPLSAWGSEIDTSMPTRSAVAIISHLRCDLPRRTSQRTDQRHRLELPVGLSGRPHVMPYQSSSSDQYAIFRIRSTHTVTPHHVGNEVSVGKGRKRSVIMRALVLADSNQRRRKVDVGLSPNHRYLIEKVPWKLKNPLHPAPILKDPIGVSALLDEIEVHRYGYPCQPQTGSSLVFGFALTSIVDKRGDKKGVDDKVRRTL